MFDVSQIRSDLLERDIRWIKTIEYFTSIDSTNAYLMRADKSVHGRVCITDYQTQGKGRRGKKWYSNEGASLMFSLGWAPKKQFGGEVSLVVGVAVADTLMKMGLEHVALKWPNDVLVDGAKLAGILLESRVCGARTELVIGMGLNILLQAALLDKLGNAWTDLALQGWVNVDRQALLITLLGNISARLQQLETSGFAPLRADWLTYHVFEGSTLRFELNGQSMTGKVVDLDNSGALMLETEGKVYTVTSGEVNMLREAS